MIEPVQSDRKIIDAEELLYEMDMSKTDSAVVLEGFGNRTTYSRDEVLNEVLKNAKR